MLLLGRVGFIRVQGYGLRALDGRFVLRSFNQNFVWGIPRPKKESAPRRSPKP